MRLDTFDQYVLAALSGQSGIVDRKVAAERAVEVAELTTALVCAKAGHSFHGEGRQRRCLRCLAPPAPLWSAAFAATARELLKVHADAPAPTDVAPVDAEIGPDGALVDAALSVSCSGCGGQCSTCRINICKAHWPLPCGGWVRDPDPNIVGVGRWVHEQRSYYGG